MEPKIDLVFQTSGKEIPVDHGFALYAAISRTFPSFHQPNDLMLSPIRGKFNKETKLLEIQPNSNFVVRLKQSELASYLALAGEILDIRGYQISVKSLRARPIIPTDCLYSHMVTTTNGEEQGRFEAEIARQLTKLEINAKFKTGNRRIFKLHGKTLVGYSLAVYELSAEESMTLQEHGLGGKKKMGCGFFEPLEK